MDDKELQKFWEWCGFEVMEQETRFEHQVLYRTSPTDTWKHLGELKLDLNNLFKYAVDEAINDIMNDNENLYSDEAMWMIFDLWIQLMEWYNPAEALYQSTQTVREATNDRDK